MRTILISAIAAIILTSLGFGLSFWGFVANGGDPFVIKGIFNEADLFILWGIIFAPIFLMALLGIWINKKEQK